MWALLDVVLGSRRGDEGPARDGGGPTPARRRPGSARDSNSPCRIARANPSFRDGWLASVMPDGGVGGDLDPAFSVPIPTRQQTVLRLFLATELLGAALHEVLLRLRRHDRVHAVGACDLRVRSFPLERLQHHVKLQLRRVTLLLRHDILSQCGERIPLAHRSQHRPSGWISLQGSCPAHAASAADRYLLRAGRRGGGAVLRPAARERASVAVTRVDVRPPDDHAPDVEGEPVTARASPGLPRLLQRRQPPREARGRSVPVVRARRVDPGRRGEPRHPLAEGRQLRKRGARRSPQS